MDTTITITYDKRYKITEATAGRDGSRPALQHVLIQYSGGHWRMIAADGFMLAIAPCYVEGLAHDETMLVYYEAFKRALKKIGLPGETGFNGERLLITQDTSGFDCFGCKWNTTGWTFPDWQHIIPRTLPSEATVCQFALDFGLIKRLTAAIGDERVQYTINGSTSPVLVTPLEGTGVGVVMPMHASDSNRMLEKWAWLGVKPAVAKEEAA